MAGNVNLVDIVSERIKTTPIGELIKEEDLYDIVKQGIERAFFTKREVKQGYHTHELPPLIIETLQVALKDAMKAPVEKWIAENNAMLLERMRDCIDSGIVNAAEALIEAKVRNAMRQPLQAMMDAINHERSSHGLPPLAVYF